MKNNTHTTNKKKHPQGGIAEMIALAFPMVVSHACYTVMTFTDRLFLSRLGPQVMNAAMAGGLTVFMMMTFFIGLISYSTALVAQYLGSKQKEGCALTTTQTFILSFFAYPIILLSRPLAHLMFEFMGVVPEQLAPQKHYFNILLYAVFFSLLRSSISSYFSGIGRTKIVMMASFVAMLVNIIANYLLIFGKCGLPALGITGAAYGTILGIFSGVVVLVSAYLSKDNCREYNVMSSFRFDPTIMKKLFRFGYPSGIEMFLNLLAFNVIILIFHSRGLAVATASTIVFNWDMVSFVPLLGIEIGVTSLVGRYMGAQKPEIANRSTFAGLKLGLVYSSVILILFLFFAEKLVGIFQPDVFNPVFNEAQPIAVFMLRFASLYVFSETIFVVFTGALRGAGDTFWAMCYSVGFHWILVPVLFVMLKIMHLPVRIGWMTLVGIFVFFSYFLYLRYKGGKWKNIEVIGIAKKSDSLSSDTFHETADL